MFNQITQGQLVIQPTSQVSQNGMVIARFTGILPILPGTITDTSQFNIIGNLQDGLTVVPKGISLEKHYGK